MRIGHGFDVHAFGGEGPIIIGGVRIPYEKGLLAHSDGDVALHALTDALLGAAALGISASCSRIPIRHLKVPIAASCYAKPGVVFRRRVIPLATSMSLSSLRHRRCCRTSTNARVLPKISAAIWMMLT